MSGARLVLRRGFALDAILYWQFDSIKLFNYSWKRESLDRPEIVKIASLLYLIWNYEPCLIGSMLAIRIELHLQETVQSFLMFWNCQYNWWHDDF